MAGKFKAFIGCSRKISFAYDTAGRFVGCGILMAGTNAATKQCC